MFGSGSWVAAAMGLKKLEPPLLLWGGPILNSGRREFLEATIKATSSPFRMKSSTLSWPIPHIVAT